MGLTRPGDYPYRKTLPSKVNREDSRSRVVMVLGDRAGFCPSHQEGEAIAASSFLTPPRGVWYSDGG